MGTKGDGRRIRFFRRYSANLALWRPDLAGRYTCPLCLRGDFEEHATRGPNPQLTEEHCIPQGLGDHRIVLTCADCNNSAGVRVDSHLHKRIDFSEFWKGSLGESFKGRMNISGHDLGVEVYRTPGNVNIHVQERTTNPEIIRALHEALTQGHQPDGFSLRFPSNHTPDVKRSRIAILKSAYLLMFRHFGFGYILSPILDVVREQISNPASDAVPLGSLVVTAPIASLPEVIGFIERPEGLGGIGVTVPLQKRGIGYLVVMPSDDKTFERWSAFAEGRDRNETIVFSYNPIPFHGSLLTEQPFNWNSHPIADSPE